MAARRERKKLETKGKILEAAAELFDRQGFAATTMEEVAHQADVGVGTVYNYFKSKDRLLLGVFVEATEELLSEGREVVSDPGDDGAQAVCRLLAVYERMSTMFGKQVMRETLAASLVQSGDAIGEYASLDMQLAQLVGELVVSLQTRGSVAADVDVESAAIALYGALILPFLLYISVDEMDTNTLHSMVQRQVRTVFKGLEPKERKSK
jgi:AcrR family transcriptional regulator